jgi:hypothetical protein
MEVFLGELKMVSILPQRHINHGPGNAVRFSDRQGRRLGREMVKLAGNHDVGTT